MAFFSRRSLASSLSHHLTRRLHPAVSHLLPSHHDHPESPSSSTPTPTPTQPPPFPSAVRRPSRSKTLSLPIPFGLHLAAYRSFSTSPTTPDSDVAAEVLSDAASAVSPLPESADFDVAAGFLSDTASTVLSDTASAVSSVPAPFPGEVTAAAADSFPLVAALQHLIDGVQTLTGLNWWACIALTTVLIRTLTIPLLVNQMKCMVKLNAMRPDIEEINTQIRNSTDPQAMLDGKQKLGELFIKHGVTPFSPLKGLLIQGPIFLSFFFAISNMVEKVPSLKGGGAYWFTDLTTPDELFIFPVLTSLTFLAMVEYNMHDGMEGNPMLQTLKKFYRAFAVLTVPCTMGFPKAIFFYWVTSNLFSLGYGYVIRKPAVRNYLDLPPMEPQPTPAQLPTFNLFGGPKSMDAAASPLDTKGSEQSTLDTKGSEQSSSVLSRQIRDLEMKAKSRGDSQE